MRRCSPSQRKFPSSEIGLGYFQETHPQELFKECSHFVELISNPAQMPQVLHRAMRAAIGKRGVAVVVIPGDVALAQAPAGANGAWPALPRRVVLPSDADLDRLAALLERSRTVTLLCGSGCAGAHDEVVSIASTLARPSFTRCGGKEHVEWDNPFDVGMTGLIGFSSGYQAIGNATRS